MPRTLEDLAAELQDLQIKVDEHEQRLTGLELGPDIAGPLDREGEDTQPAIAIPLVKPPRLPEPAWLVAARSDLDLHERPGPESAPRIATAFALVGLPGRDDSSTAWCSAINALWISDGGKSIRCPVTPRTPLGRVTAAARSWMFWGVKLERPVVGAVAVLSRGESQSLGHVGLVVGWDDTTLTLVSGNSANRVRIERYDRSRLLSLRWPS